MYDLTRRIGIKITSPEYKSKLMLLQNKTLRQATKATGANTLQYKEVPVVAQALLGEINSDIATFSFSGASANKITLSKQLQSSQVNWSYSLDGGNTWKDVYEHSVELTPEEVASITVNNDIKVHISGLPMTDANIYTIDITKRSFPTGLISINDEEDRMIGVTDEMEWTLNPADGWNSFANTNPIFSGNKRVYVRVIAKGTEIASDPVYYTFTDNSSSETNRYITRDKLNVIAVSGTSGGNKDNILDGNINTARDIETINLELIFSDIDVVARRIDRTKKALKGDKKLQGQLDFLERLKEHLENGKSARGFDFTDEERIWIKETPLLSAKPVIYAANMSEADFTEGIDSNPNYKTVCDIAAEEKSAVLPICAKIEAEISDMDAEDKAMFLEELNLEESGLNRIIREGYSLLGLISYLTAGQPEVRAWTITRGTKAPQAAGKIHTDFEKGFIRAEVVSFDDLMECGSMSAAKEKGLVRLEGKDYVMQDGDIVLFRFNV